MSSSSSEQSCEGNFQRPSWCLSSWSPFLLFQVESKDSAPPDYILYDVPPKEPSRKEPKTKQEAQQVKGEEKKSGSGNKDSSDESKKPDTLDRMLSPFRLVASRLRRTRLEEDEDLEPKEEGPKEDTLSEEPEAEKKKVKVKLGRSKDHERLEETGEGGDKEGEERNEPKMEKRAAEEARGSAAAAGFGNPLYGSEDLGAVVDKDLGEAGTTGNGAAADRPRRNRAGFENPLFEDSKVSSRMCCLSVC